MRGRGTMILLCRSTLFSPSLPFREPGCCGWVGAHVVLLEWMDCTMADVRLYRVFLHATDESALKTVAMEDLKRFAAEGEAANASSTAQTPSGKQGAMVRETH